MANQLKKIQISLIKCIFYICWEKTNIGCELNVGQEHSILYSHMTPFGPKQTLFIYLSARIILRHKMIPISDDIQS